MRHTPAPYIPPIARGVGDLRTPGPVAIVNNAAQGAEAALAQNDREELARALAGGRAALGETRGLAYSRRDTLEALLPRIEKRLGNRPAAPRPAPRAHVPTMRPAGLVHVPTMAPAPLAHVPDWEALSGAEMAGLGAGLKRGVDARRGAGGYAKKAMPAGGGLALLGALWAATLL